jgi:hypothetical protein
LKLKKYSFPFQSEFFRSNAGRQEFRFSMSGKNSDPLNLSDLECQTGLPDGLISNQKYQFGEIFEGVAMEGVVI